METFMGTFEHSVQMPSIAESLFFSIALPEEPRSTTLTQVVDEGVGTMGSTIRGIEMPLLCFI
jgi:hypothetical protein